MNFYKKNGGCDFPGSVKKQYIRNSFLGKDYLYCTGFISNVLGLWVLSLTGAMPSFFTSGQIMGIINNSLRFSSKFMPITIATIDPKDFGGGERNME